MVTSTTRVLPWNIALHLTIIKKASHVHMSLLIYYYIIKVRECAENKKKQEKKLEKATTKDKYQCTTFVTKKYFAGEKFLAGAATPVRASIRRRCGGSIWWDWTFQSSASRYIIILVRKDRATRLPTEVRVQCGFPMRIK